MNAATYTVAARRPRPAVKPTEVVAPVRLHPKEHGAYAILGVPLVAALCIEKINAVVVLIMVAAIAGFMAHEPLMIAMGRRGRRALLAAPQAASRFSLLMFVALWSGGMAIWWAPPDVRLALAVCLLFAGLGFALSAAGLQRTLPVQMIDMLSLTLPSSAMLLAGGVNQDVVVRLSAAWVMGRIATTTAVRSAIAKMKTSLHRDIPIMNDAIFVSMIVACPFGILSGLGELIVITPMLATAVWLRFLPPGLIHLRTIGWLLLAVNILCAVWMVYFCLSQPNGIG